MLLPSKAGEISEAGHHLGYDVLMYMYLEIYNTSLRNIWQSFREVNIIQPGRLD